MRMLTWDLISGEMKYIHFGVLSTSHNCLHDTTRNESHWECYFIAVILTMMFWQKWNFISGDKISSKYYPKWNHMKGNICTCADFIKTKVIAFYWMGRFSWTTPKTKFHYTSPGMKSNVNRISLMADWNFILGRFYFRSHVNTF